MIMRRKLYLIISDGGGNTPLRGVHIDKENFLNFFKAPEGGAWKDDEIMVFDNNDFDLEILRCNDLTAKIEKKPIDFYLIVYCGHGFTDQYNQIYLEVRPDVHIKLDDLLEVVARSRSLVIADSCRLIFRLQEGGRIASRRLFSTSAEARNSAYAKICRDWYNYLIELTPPTMHFVCFSNSYGETADEDSRDGGVYCHELLTMAKRKKEEFQNLQQHNINSYYATIDEIHAEAADMVVKNTFDRQHPEILKSCRSLARFPFVVVPHLQLQLED